MPASTPTLDREERLQKIGGHYDKLITEIEKFEARVTATLAKISPATSDDPLFPSI